MEFPEHTLCNLFAQLGLASDAPAITGFFADHAALPGSMLLAEAPFWNPAQADFLREQLLADADWAEVVDELNVRLHH